MNISNTLRLLGFAHKESGEPVMLNDAAEMRLVFQRYHSAMCSKFGCGVDFHTADLVRSLKTRMELTHETL